jgi:hypothetical protein
LPLRSKVVAVDNPAAVSPVEDNPVVSRVVEQDSPVVGDPVVGDPVAPVAVQPPVNPAALSTVISPIWEIPAACNGTPIKGVLFRLGRRTRLLVGCLQAIRSQGLAT